MRRGASRVHLHRGNRGGNSCYPLFDPLSFPFTFTLGSIWQYRTRFRITGEHPLAENHPYAIGNLFPPSKSNLDLSEDLVRRYWVCAVSSLLGALSHVMGWSSKPSSFLYPPHFNRKLNPIPQHVHLLHKYSLPVSFECIQCHHRSWRIRFGSFPTTATTLLAFYPKFLSNSKMSPFQPAS